MLRSEGEDAGNKQAGKAARGAAGRQGNDHQHQTTVM